MSIFPTKILLAADGSEEAALAARSAAELSEETDSEVHVVYVLPTEAQLVGPHLYSEEIRASVIEQAERDARSFLEEQAQRVSSEGGKVAEVHLRVGRPDKEIVRLAGVLDAGTIDVSGPPATFRDTLSRHDPQVPYPSVYGMGIEAPQPRTASSDNAASPPSGTVQAIGPPQPAQTLDSPPDRSGTTALDLPKPRRGVRDARADRTSRVSAGVSC